MIVGIGVDIVDLTRMELALQRAADRAELAGQSVAADWAEPPAWAEPPDWETRQEAVGRAERWAEQSARADEVRQAVR